MRGGFVKIYRTVYQNPLLARRYRRQAVWFWLLLNADYAKGREVYISGKYVTLKPGQLTAGAFQIQNATGVKHQTVNRILKEFKNEDMIEIRATPQFSLITIKNWKRYQENEKLNGKRMRKK